LAEREVRVEFQAWKRGAEQESLEDEETVVEVHPEYLYLDDSMSRWRGAYRWTSRAPRTLDLSD